LKKYVLENISEILSMILKETLAFRGNVMFLRKWKFGEC
jgi:hypothetical protein